MSNECEQRVSLRLDRRARAFGWAGGQDDAGAGPSGMAGDVQSQVGPQPESARAKHPNLVNRIREARRAGEML